MVYIKLKILFKLKTLFKLKIQITDTAKSLFKSVVYNLTFLTTCPQGKLDAEIGCPEKDQLAIKRK